MRIFDCADFISDKKCELIKTKTKKVESRKTLNTNQTDNERTENKNDEKKMKMVEINKNPFESHIIGIFICSIFQYTNTVVNLLTIHFVLQIRTESESSGDDPYTSLHVFQINTHEIFCSDLPSYI